MPVTHWFPWLDTWWVGAALVALDLVAVTRALMRGHGVASTAAWILAVIAFPGGGAVAYLLLANPSIKGTVRRRAALHLGAPDSVHVVTAAQKEHRILRLATKLTERPATSGNRVEFLAEDEYAFSEIEQAIARSVRTIWAEYYLVRNDETGHRFLDLLAARAREGIGVRLLYDALGSMGLDGARLRAIRAAGGRVESFLPVNPLRRRWAVHLRNHRKLVVIDGEVAFTGGMNIGDEYSGRSRRRGEQHFRDTHLRVAGPAVREFAAVFAGDWQFATGESVELPVVGSCSPGAAAVGALPSGPDQRVNASAHVFFAGIMTAREQCFLTTPYFIPDEPTVRALVTAASSGVDVRVLVPADCDVALVAAAARSYYRELILGGVRIFEYRPSMLHAKTMVVDRHWGVVGSANVDMRSFRLNFEIGALVVDPEFGSALARRFLDELEDSHEITLETLHRLGWAHKVAGGLARLLSPLL